MRLIVKLAVVGVVSYAAYRAVRYLAPEGVGTFVAQVRTGVSEREAQLREALGLDVVNPHGDDRNRAPRHGHGPASAGSSGRLTPEEAKALLDDPARSRPGQPGRAGQG